MGSPIMIPQFLAKCNALIQVQSYEKVHVETVFAQVKKLFGFITGEKHPTNCKEDSENVQFGPVLTAVTESNFLLGLVKWGVAPKNPPDDAIKYFVIGSLLHEFDFLISQSKQNILYSSGVFQPLVRLLDQSLPATQKLNCNLSRLLKTLCILLCRDSLLLDFTKQVSSDVVKNEYLIFSKLVPLLHLQGEAGNNARDAVLLILSLSDRDPQVAEYLTSTSDICPVLATGLSGLYSSLPKRILHDNSRTTTTSPEILRVHGAGWHRLTKIDCRSCGPLSQFMKTLVFCDLAVRISHPSVRKDFLFYIYSGFLTPVVGSALHQHSLDEAVAAEAYLELSLRRLTAPPLIGLFLRFILASTYDNCSVALTLIDRINVSNETLVVVTLSLFRTILNLNCEDAMFLLVFRYLNSMDFETSGNKPAEAKSVDRDWWLNSANRFLGLSSWPAPLEASIPGVVNKDPGSQLAATLSAVRRQLASRAQSTSMWSSDYSQEPQLPPSASSGRTLPSGHPLLDRSPRLHSTPLRPPLSRAPLEPPGLLDQYRSKSEMYQLSYVDDDDDDGESDSEAVDKAKQREEEGSEAWSVKAPEKVPEEPTMPTPEPTTPLAAIQLLLKSIGDGPADDAVTEFLEILGKASEEDQEEEVRMPYPAVDEFTLRLLDYRLGKLAAVLVTPKSDLSKNPVQPPVTSPLDNLSLDEDIEIICRNELPEVPFELAGNKTRRSLCVTLGPFLEGLLLRLSKMAQQNFYTNLLLTDIFVILVSFQQYPLAHLLLRTVDAQSPQQQQQVHPRSLSEVLTNLRKGFEDASNEIPDWQSWLEQAMLEIDGRRHRQPEKVLPSVTIDNEITCGVVTEDNLLAVAAPQKASTPQAHVQSSPISRGDLPPAAPNRRGRPSAREWHSDAPQLVAEIPLQRTALGNSPSPRSTSGHPRRLSLDRLAQLIPTNLSPSQPIPSHPLPPRRTSQPPSMGVSTRMRNTVNAYIVFNGFCMELACLCCEHGVSFASALPNLEKAIKLEHALAEL